VKGVGVRAVVFREGSTWAVEEVPTAEPGPGEVRLRLLLTGVCGTDMHLLHGGFIAKFPLIPGHEMIGEIDAIGDGVTDIAVGQRAVVDNATNCGRCRQCRRGKPLFCSAFVSLGCNAPGGFAEYVVVRAEKCYAMDSVPPEVAVFTEPLSCAMHGVDVLALNPASDVLVFGAGPTGLLLAQLLRLAGAARVTVAAPSEHKLELARSFGIESTVRIDRADPSAGIGELHRLAPHGFDAVVEATGAVSVLDQCPSLTTEGGTILVYGLAQDTDLMALRPYEVFSRELTVRGSFAQMNCFDRATAVLRGGRVRTEGMITDRVSLDDFGGALDGLNRSATIKTVVAPHD
jgi:D-arabinitol dehydrogenase (NADP+)